VAKGYESLHYTVRIEGNGTRQQVAEVHEAVMETSPNFYNLARVRRPAPIRHRDPLPRGGAHPMTRVGFSATAFAQ
jgi:hypothetical protein